MPWKESNAYARNFSGVGSPPHWLLRRGEEGKDTEMSFLPCFLWLLASASAQGAGVTATVTVTAILTSTGISSGMESRPSLKSAGVSARSARNLGETQTATSTSVATVTVTVTNTATSTDTNFVTRTSVTTVTDTMIFNR